MTIRPTFVLAAAAIAVLAALPAQAQTSRSTANRATGTTTQGLFGSNTVGGNASTMSPSSRAATGQAGTSGTQQQNIALEARTMAPAVATQQQPGAFIGADTGDTGNFRSRQTGAVRTTAPNFAQLGNLFAQGMQQINQANNQGNRQQTPVRVSLRLGFAPQPVAPVTVAAFESRLTQLPAIRFVGPAQVTMEGRTAVLRGTVASEDDRQLAEDLAMMEPAVQNVRNELVVDSTATAAEPLPLAPATRSP
jgi:hypothetical protein